MKLRSLQIDQLRKFDQPVRIGGLGDGVNLIAGPNEMGKSTLVTALWAALFERHRANTQAVRSLQPNTVEGAAPWVALEFETGEGLHRIEKRFLRRPMARLTLPSGKRIENDDAETALHRLLGIEAAPNIKSDQGAPGHWGVIWVAQTQSFEQPAFNDSARGALQTRLEAEFDALTGRAASEALLRSIEASLHELIDRRLGRPKGRYKELEDELGKVEAAIAELDRAELELADEIGELQGLQTQLETQQRPQTTGQEEAELDRLQARRQSLTELAAALREAEASVKLARYELDRLETALHRRAHLAEQIEILQVGKADAEAAEATAGTERERAAERLEICRRKLARIETLRGQADQRLKQLCRLQRVIEQRDRSQAALEAVASEVEIDVLPAAVDQIKLDGVPLGAARQTVKLVAPLDLQIDGIGAIRLRPFLPDAGRLREQQQSAEDAIARLVADLTAGDQAARITLPDSRAATVEAIIADTDRQLDEIGTAVEALRRQIDQLQDKVAASQAAQERARLRLVHCSGELQRLFEDRNSLPSADLAPELAATKRALANAIQNRDRLMGQSAGQAAEELQALDRREAELRAALEARTRKVHELQLAIEGLRSRVQLRCGEGLGERRDELRRRHAELTRQHARLEREAATLALLRDTLRQAEQDARDQYLRPVLDRIQPYVQMLLPGAELTIGDDFRVTTIQRGPASGEAFSQLSDGTREQIAVLARLAFAEMLHDQGLPALVVLDDVLVFADDHRLQTMFRILERAAEKLQILVLTCRERHFAELAATPIRIEPEPQPLPLRSAAR
jgi:DNA repair exonuclease SbcCD ATPase subunit